MVGVERLQATAEQVVILNTAHAPLQLPCRRKRYQQTDPVAATRDTPARVQPSVTVAPRTDIGRLVQKKDIVEDDKLTYFSGSTKAYCGTGCKAAFGTCSNALPSVATTLQTSTRSAAVPAPSASLKVSTNARCGNLNGATGGFTCEGSTFGNCCSQCVFLRLLSNALC